MTKKVHVKIPATSANMGSGFDAVGIALTPVSYTHLTLPTKLEV